MHLNRNPRRLLNSVTLFSTARRTRILLGCGLAALACIVLLAGAAQPGQQEPSADKPSATSDTSQSPDLNDQAKPPQQPPAKQAAETPGGEHKRQISDDSAKLLTLAMALKAEVDKTNKDTLSLNVIRKADEIEKLAHSVRDKMRVSVGGS
jgi:hypothetical protein